MRLDELEFVIPAAPAAENLLNHFSQVLLNRLPDGTVAVRFAVTRCDDRLYQCEVGILDLEGEPVPRGFEPIFRLNRRALEDTRSFTTVLIVPTGIGAEIGGHAGDATPVARLLAGVSDTLVTHPNVVNGADVNEIPDNSLYVEGSVISRLLMGTVGLQPVRSNRILLLVDAHEDDLFVNAAINAANTARTAAGINVEEVWVLDTAVRMIARYCGSGRAVGEVKGVSYLRRVFDEIGDRFDAVGITTLMDVSQEMSDRYFESDGSVVNPYGGVEATLTHALSGLFDLPTAHAPMELNREMANKDPGVLDPRMAAEGISWPMVYSVLKGLHRSPKVIRDPSAFDHPGVLSASSVSCLVIPAGCLGLPTLAALYQGVPVIEVRENRNLMRNDLSSLPWRPGQLTSVSSYLEAAGVIAAIRSGVDPLTLQRSAGLGVKIVQSDDNTDRVKHAQSLSVVD